MINLNILAPNLTIIWLPTYSGEHSIAPTFAAVIVLRSQWVVFEESFEHVWKIDQWTIIVVYFFYMTLIIMPVLFVSYTTHSFEEARLQLLL